MRVSCSDRCSDSHSVDSRDTVAHLLPLSHPTLEREHQGDETLIVVRSLLQTGGTLRTVGALLQLAPLLLVQHQLAVDAGTHLVHARGQPSIVNDLYIT